LTATDVVLSVNQVSLLREIVLKLMCITPPDFFIAPECQAPAKWVKDTTKKRVASSRRHSP